MTPARNLVRDRRGATIVEFGLVAPVLCLLLMGAMDIGHMLYLQALMQGAMQKASRDASLETATNTTRQAAIDTNVRKQVQLIARNATVTFNRRYYRSFSEAAAATPEDWDDTNRDGTCNRGERYEDANGNSVWDADGGNAGQGGAKDAALYTVTVQFDSLFPLWKFVGGAQRKTLTAKTILRNQPYNDQDSYGAATWRNCA